uniref:Uncharacterized protein n=1 Tax=Rhizophora mucronata TaxID=61149 RepID=A0A2P2NAB8_RHIMU
MRAHALGLLSPLVRKIESFLTKAKVESVPCTFRIL